MYRAVAVAITAIALPISAKCPYAHYTLAGTVTAQSGGGVAGATIEVNWRDALEMQSQRLTSGVKGTYASDLIFDTFSRRTLLDGDLCESRLSSANVKVVAPGYKSQSGVVHFTNQRAQASFVLER
jgi:hypothetical protein